MRKWVSCVIAGLTLNYALGTVSCSSDPSSKEDTESARRGTLKMQLQTVSPSGKVYRLRQALFLVDPAFFFPLDNSPEPLPVSLASPDAGVVAAGGFSAVDGGIGPFIDSGVGGRGAGGALFGAGGAFLAGGGFAAGGSPGSTSVVLDSEQDPDSPVVETFLAAGNYQIVLLDGWFIEQVDRLLGTAAFVDATLVNGPFQFFGIESNEETFVQYEFEVDGERVVFGPPGRLIVGIDVHERDGGAALCGNGRTDDGESCDTFDLAGETCASVTMGALPFGSLRCSSVCTFDLSECFDGVDGGSAGASGFDGGGGVSGI